MSQMKVSWCVVIAVLMLCANCNEVLGQAKCCTEHYELGACRPGIDDDPKTNGKCWAFCTSGCPKGGVCKETGNNNHHCHCYC
ncbi:hypothetical protein P3X46_006236 [Hevea brasiliensis]|uniref:Knottin scorpion toxin-like domain-containing protein n=1 Tax=Hevea brasiliensis TaxID=3981 RepID=A0ABQ9MTC8_HEVBR|nr:hypothetical protein P3X46_006236 [Hevea brasiliensis]